VATPVPTAGARLGDNWRLPFAPLFRDPHIQTIIGRYWPARLDENVWPTHALYFATEPGVKVLAHYNRRDGQGPDPRGAQQAGALLTAPTVLAVHGLTASSEAPYMRLLAGRTLEAGFNSVRLNVRNCGGTEHLCPTLYHSGLTADLRSVVEQLAPAPLYLVGFSMGGNMVLKLAGEWGEAPPAHVRAVCGISVPVRLGVCARRLGERRNRIYEARFLRELRRTLLRKQEALSGKFVAPRWDGIRTIYEFDDAITAPAFGFRGADHYYDSASSAGFLDRIRVPALLIQAQDDPFIPYDVFEDLALEQNPNLYLEAPPHGGHVAFLARQGPRFWAIEQAVRFFETMKAQRDHKASR
jgi:predicted alpha/beta-fold hydrolase